MGEARRGLREEMSDGEGETNVQEIGLGVGAYKRDM